MKLIPAELAFDTAGTPWSPAYGDIYHSAESGPGQARHVFLQGNDLPARWSGAPLFTIVETGFGLGLNFLATWQAWRDDPARCGRLHYVSVEKHPYTRDALATLHQRHDGFAPLAMQLQAVWPELVPGMHRIEFEQGRVTLTLAFADVAELLPRLRAAADAFFLDGFSPEKNPDMWTPRLMKGLARVARPNATLATYTTARLVRDGLEAAGFQIEKRPGFGRKREMLAGRFAPRRAMRHAPAAAPIWPERRAIVIGAGLAGAAVSERLAARGWRIDLIERHPAPAAEASGMYAGAFHPHVSRDDSVLSRLARCGFLYALKRWQALEAAGYKVSWRRCGLLQLATSSADETHMAGTMDALGYPSSYVQYADRETANRHAGLELRAGGWWFAEGGWMRPSSLVAAQLDASANLVPHFGKAVASLVRRNEHWQAFAEDGTLIASSPVVVLANSHDAARLAPFAQALGSSRGQLTYLPAQALPDLRAVLTGNAYLLPAIYDLVVAGTTYDFDDDCPEPRSSGHEEILSRLGQLLSAGPANPDIQKLRGAVGFRCVAPDRMPLIGALPDLQAARARCADLSGAHLIDMPRLPGLYSVSALASRGLIWATLGGELVASQIEGDPLPVEGDLVDAVDPARFALKLARRGRL